MMRVTRRTFAASAASAILASTIGCTSMVDKSELSAKPGSTRPSLLDRLPWAEDKPEVPEPYPNPVKLASIWNADTLIQTGRQPTRGFGGRIFFYDEKSRPVPVEGTLVVHGFNDKASEASEAVKRFEFTPEQFTRHFSQSDLGASYSIWIPWDAVGGKQTQVSLVASFETSEGKMVQGVPAMVLLPGTRTELKEQLADRLSPQYRKWQQAANGEVSRSSGLTTTTIHRRSRLPAAANGDDAQGFDAVSKPMMASDSATPSANIRMTKQPAVSDVRPASAQLPIQR